jgi:hypothetical protein
MTSWTTCSLKGNGVPRSWASVSPTRLTVRRVVRQQPDVERALRVPERDQRPGPPLGLGPEVGVTEDEVVTEPDRGPVRERRLRAVAAQQRGSGSSGQGRLTGLRHSDGGHDVQPT